MKTLRTVLITFGLTTLFYGAFALLIVSIDPAFAARSIYQMFRVTGFPILIVGIACLLLVLVISFAYAAFRDDPKSRRAQSRSEEEDSFLENETVPAEEYEATYSSVVQRKARPRPEAEPEEPDDAEDDGEKDETPPLDESLFRSRRAEGTQHCIYCGTAFSASETVCPRCGKRV